MAFPAANNVYANQYVAYVPLNQLNQIAQGGVPSVPIQQVQYPHIVDHSQSNLQHPAASGGFCPNPALLQSLPEKLTTAAGTQSLPNISNKQPLLFVQPIPPLPTANNKQQQQSNENNQENQESDSKSSPKSSPPSSDQDHEVITNENVMSQPQVQPVVMLKDHELLKSIQYERQASNFKTAMLTEQVKEYNLKLVNLKKEVMRRRRRLIILRKVYGDSWKESLVEMLREREFDFNTYSETYEQRLYHERQLEIVEGQHGNLTAMAQQLSARLKTVVHEYQSLNSSLDPAAAAQLQTGHGWPAKDAPFCPDGAMAISNNAHFKQLVAQNRRLERQIKFIKGIIENEAARHDNGCGIFL